MLRFRRSSDARGSTPSSAQIMSTASQPLCCVRPQQKSSFISLTQWERPGSNNHSHSRCQNRGDPEMKTENMSFFDFSNFTFSSIVYLDLKGNPMSSTASYPVQILLLAPVWCRTLSSTRHHHCYEEND